MRIDESWGGPAAGHPDGVADAHTVQPCTLTQGANALVTEDMPSGLPFLGEDPPPCSHPVMVPIFEDAGSLHDARVAIRTAKQVCAACPYLTPCAEWAISNGERWGIWGGTTFKERRRERRRRKRMTLMESLHKPDDAESHV